MTFAKHLTEEEKREANRIKAARYRAKNPAYFKLYEKKRNPVRYAKERAKIFKGKKCLLCEIPLATPVYGAIGTKIHCLSCSKDLRTISRLRMRKWREKKKLLQVKL